MDITLDDLRPRESQPVSKQSADLSYELVDMNATKSEYLVKFIQFLIYIGESKV